MSANATSMVGNLVADPELRFTSTARPVANFRFAVNERIVIDGAWQDRTNFFNVVAWGDLAQNVAGSLSQGDRIMVNGRIQIREYTDGNSVKQYRTEVVADEVGAALRFHTISGIEKAVATKELVGAAAGPTEEPF